MATSNNANIGFEKQIWDAACVLWGHIPAADYRKVIVGLIFLRYISSAFEKRYLQLVEEGDGFEDDRDAYTEENIFFVPEEARWSTISAAAHEPEIGKVIDDAMRAIEKENTSLKNVLPKIYASPDLDKRVLGEVVDLFTNMDMGDTEDSKDLLGRTYEYCIQQFAAYEGVKGGDHRQGGNHPADCIDLILIQKFDQLDRHHEQLSRNEVGRRAEFQCRVQLLEAGVEIQRRLVSENCVFIKFKHIGKLRNVIKHRAVARHHTLRYTRGAGGKYYINRVGVERRLMDLCQRRLVHRRATDLIVAHNASRKGKLFRCLFRPVVTDNQSGL